MNAAGWRWLSTLGLALALGTGCGGRQRAVLFVPSSLGIQGTDPNLPPVTVSVDFLGIIKVDNLAVMNRHPDVQLSVWMCGEQHHTLVARWKAGMGWPDSRFVIPPECSPTEDAYVAILNEESGNYIAYQKLRLGDLMRNKPVELEGNGGSIMLNVRTYELPRADEPRRLSIAVPANRPVGDLAVAAGTATGNRLPVEGWVPIPVAQGDLVSLHATGEICRGNDCFGPEGRRDFFGSSYRLKARVGNDLLDIHDGNSFVVQRTGDLELFVDDAGPNLRGAFAVEVEINPPGSREVKPVGLSVHPPRSNHL